MKVQLVNIIIHYVFDLEIITNMAAAVDLYLLHAF